MAHKSSNGVKDEGNTNRNAMEEKHDDSAKVTQGLNNLMLNNSTYTGHNQCAYQEACATSFWQPEDETPLKSYNANKALATSSALSSCEDTRMNGEESDIDRRQDYPTQSVGLQLRQTMQQSNYHYHSPSNMNQPVAQSPFVSINTAAMLSAQDTSRGSSVLSTTVSGDSSLQLLPLDMNIPPSLYERRINNTSIPFAFAEQQPSFRTTSTVVSDLSPIARGAGSQQDHRQHIQNGTHQTNFNSVTRENSQFQLRSCPMPYMSSEDNSQNVSVYPLLGHPPMTAQPMGRSAQMWQNNGGCPSGGGCAGYRGHISHSNSSSSLKSFINNDCLVKKLYWTILRHVALTLQCRYSSASWKDLVEMYGWDYERTYLFENRSHQEGIFFSLLQEPEFQDYSLEQLRNDLFNLPRRDVLNDLNRMINEHNATASGGATSQNQLN